MWHLMIQNPLRKQPNQSPPPQKSPIQSLPLTPHQNLLSLTPPLSVLLEDPRVTNNQSLHRKQPSHSRLPQAIPPQSTPLIPHQSPLPLTLPPRALLGDPRVHPNHKPPRATLLQNTPLTPRQTRLHPTPPANAQLIPKPHRRQRVMAAAVASPRQARRTLIHRTRIRLPHLKAALSHPLPRRLHRKQPLLTVEMQPPSRRDIRSPRIPQHPPRTTSPTIPLSRARWSLPVVVIPPPKLPSSLIL